jgi:putative hydrolase of the HAD superfamily
LLIVFDLDDTLIDTSGVITPFKLREFLSFLMRNQVDVGAEDEAMQEMQAFDRQCVSSKDTIRFCLERYRAVHLYDQALAQYFAPLPKNFIVSLTPNAKKILQFLKEQGHLLALVTGGRASYQMEKLEKAGLEPSIFSKISVAENSQKKPHYEAIVQEFRQPPREMIAVGDRIQMDLLPAHELGWRTVHMCWGRGKIGKPATWVDHSIPELSKLLEIV